jgi:hypothetical protein
MAQSGLVGWKYTMSIHVRMEWYTGYRAIVVMSGLSVGNVRDSRV